jgi:hypothetical protein
VARLDAVGHGQTNHSSHNLIVPRVWLPKHVA